VDGHGFTAAATRTATTGSNTSHDVGDLLTAAGHEWATSHTFRHTVCTLLGQAGWSWREIANYVGHKKASMTMDTYASRQTVNEGMAAALVIGTSKALATA
jgi:integrase